MKMDVMLDANVILADPRMQGNYFSELFAYLRRTGSRLVLPTVVFKEVSARYQEFLARLLDSATSAWNKVGHFCNVPALPEMVVCEEVRKFKRRLCNPAQGVRTIFYRRMTEAHIREVVRRGVDRIVPASPKGEELRDVVLWLVALQFAKETRQPLALITNDSGFANQSKDGLHPKLADECARAQVSLHFYRDLHDFVVKNALTQEPIDAAWFFAHVPKDRTGDAAIAMLRRLTTDRGPVQAAEVSQLEFASGQKYEVAENSYFIESSLAGEGRITILENMLTTYANTESMWTTNANWGQNFVSVPYLTIGGTTDLYGMAPINHYSSLGTPALGPSLAGINVSPGQEMTSYYLPGGPLTAEISYKCKFMLHLSARVVSESLEALEPDSVDIEELAPIGPERPGPPHATHEVEQVTTPNARPRRSHFPSRRRRTS